MLVKFFCNTDNKKDYYTIKSKVTFNRATIMRERVRDLKDDFYAEFDLLSVGRTLYRDLKQSGVCKKIFLKPGFEEDTLE